MKAYNKHSLLSLFLLMAALALVFGLDARSKHLRSLAAKHHYESLAAGYSAAAIQKPMDIEWEWKYPTPVKWDRETVQAAIPHWQRSTYHANVRDIYLARARQPWWPVGALPDQPEICILPDGNDQIEPWWKERFGGYTDANPCFWNVFMAFSCDEPNCELTQTLLSTAELDQLSSHWYAERKRVASNH